MGKKSRRVRNGGRIRQQQQQQQLPPSPPPAIPRPPPTVDHHHQGAVVVSAENRSQGESDREKLNRLMHEFKSPPSSDPWDVNRILTMALYCSTIKDNFNVVLDEDYKFLQAIGRSLTETALSRSFAWLVLGFLHFNCCHESTDLGVVDPRGKTVQYYDAAIAAIDSMSTVDKEQPFIGEIVTFIQETYLRGLEICAGATQNQWNRSTQLPALVAGLYCDGCMKPRDEILNVCGACRKAHYCGQACQRQAWNNGHKLFCRKTGEFRVGDVALTKDPFGSINYCHPVRIKGPAPTHPLSTQAPRQWEIESMEDGENGNKITKFVPASRLMRARPGLWSMMWTGQLSVVDNAAMDHS